MDHQSFDRLARAFGTPGSRRSALGALLGTGLAGAFGAVHAARKDRTKRRKSGKKGKGTAQVAAQAADCLNPGPSSNISGCSYQNEDFSGADLSGSKMVATNFRGADLFEADLSSSNAKNAIFREANLSCADLRSSTLSGADFRAANLTGANLKSSSGCNTAQFNAATTFCATTMCDGSVRNDDCPGGQPVNLCGTCEAPFEASSCDCLTTTEGSPACLDDVAGHRGPACSLANPSCPAGQTCAFSPCNSGYFCFSSCPSPDPCTCASGAATCTPAEFKRCGLVPAAVASRSAGPRSKP